jgi:hypothetical protein
VQKLRDISDFYSDKLSDSSFIDNSGQSLSKMVKKVFNKRLKAGQIDKKVFDYNYKKLIDAAEKGGLNLNVKYGAPDWEYAQTLKNNLATFAAFKQHNEGQGAGRLLEMTLLRSQKNTMLIGLEANSIGLRAQRVLLSTGNDMSKEASSILI